MKYKCIKKQLDDKTLYEKTLRLLNSRIEHKIDEKLGMHGLTLSEIKVKCSKQPDRFTAVLAELEDLDNERTFVKAELSMIEDYLKDIDRSISKMNDREKNIFKYKYIYGLSNKDIENKGIASDKTIRNTIKEITKNL